MNNDDELKRLFQNDQSASQLINVAEIGAKTINAYFDALSPEIDPTLKSELVAEFASTLWNKLLKVNET